MKFTRKIRTSICLLSIFLLVSCSYTPEELLLKLNKDERYVSLAQSDICAYSLQWLPKEYLTAMEFQSPKAPKPDLLEEREKDYDRSYYFRLNLELKSGDNAMLSGVGSVPEYSGKWNYLTYGMLKNLYVLTASYDTIYPMFYTFQNPHIYNNKLSFLYVFSKTKLEAQKDKGFMMKYKDELFAQRAFDFAFQDFEALTQKNYNLTIKN